MWQFEPFLYEIIETVLLTTKLLVRAWFEVVRTARTNHCTGAVSMVRRATALGATTSTCTMHGTAVLKGLSELVSLQMNATVCYPNPRLPPPFNPTPLFVKTSIELSAPVNRYRQIHMTTHDSVPHTQNPTSPQNSTVKTEMRVVPLCLMYESNQPMLVKSQDPHPSVCVPVKTQSKLCRLPATRQNHWTSSPLLPSPAMPRLLQEPTSCY